MAITPPITPPTTPPTQLPRVDRPPPPDWNLVPFEVHCPRCGCDVHGRTDPTCPQCNLDLDFSAIAPIEELTCPKCGYRLYGLRESRCPECGGEFAWHQALAQYHVRKHGFIEYQWKRKPIRSFFTTLMLSLVPRRFWRRIDINIPPRVWPLLWYWMIAAAGATLILGALAAYAIQWIQWLKWGSYYSKVPGIAIFPSLTDCVRFWMTGSGPIIMVLVSGWTVATYLALSVFQWSMRKARIRQVHVLRVAVYVTAGPWVALCLTYTASGIIVELLDWHWIHNCLVVFLLGLLVVFACVSTHMAYRWTLKMPHSLAIALVGQLLAALIMFTGWITAVYQILD